MVHLLRLLPLLFLCWPGTCVRAQTGNPADSVVVGEERALVAGRVTTPEGEALSFATVSLNDGRRGTLTDETGHFTLTGPPPAGKYRVTVSLLGYGSQTFHLEAESGEGPTTLNVELAESAATLEQVTVSGTLKPVSRSNSPVPVEVYTAAYFRANPTPSVFESLQNVNGVRPQLNCNVCNTGDIHINGLEGPYTMVLIDGMPLVSGLSTVYGLTGIPRSLIERTEVVKGPASTLYGSEAVGGLINVITKSPGNAPALAVDVMGTSWGEINADLGVKFGVGESATSLLGVNYFNYAHPRDDNNDGFTDVTLQDRISVFSKWSFARRKGRVFSLAGRYVYEDRWGGELDYGPAFRGGDRVYGEGIYTNRWEAFGVYQLPLPQRVNFQFSVNGHYHDSAYGTTLYRGTQYVGFGQLTYNEQWGANHDLLLGAAYRYTWYDDNTPATAAETTNAPSRIHLPGLFVQDEIRLRPQHTLLLGLRYDHNSRHGSILTPRVNYKWNSKDNSDVVRLSAGNGYRVANVFTEDHAALTGARQTVFAEALKPETSHNVNVNYVKKVYTWGRSIVGFDASAWYTYFTNRILPDYTTDPNRIIYANLDGYAVSRGASLNVDLTYPSGFNANVGLTYQDVFTQETGARESRRERQLLTESASAVWKISRPFGRGWSADYTGNLYGPMELPLLGPLDDRPATSPWFSIQNLQVTKEWAGGWEVYGGLKNLLNYTPPANSIARAFDPFDTRVTFGPDGQVVPTADNPRALTFDPTYVFAPNQGLRAFLGVRWTVR